MRIRKIAGSVLLVLAGLVLGKLLPWPAMSPLRDRSVMHEHAGPSLEQIRELASLTTLSVDVADVQMTDLRGHVGGIKVALLIKGEVQLAVDLGQGRWQSLDPAGRRAVLVLSQPKVAQARLDHARTRLFAISSYGLWQVVPTDRAYTSALNQAYAEAQRAVTAAGQQPVLVERARRQAESVLGGYGTALGWQLTVRWTGSPSQPGR